MKDLYDIYIDDVASADDEGPIEKNFYFGRLNDVTEVIDGLTVKERKNLINGILRQQDDIAITKQRFKVMQTIIRQVVIAVLTVSISIPLVYHAINASLEATIDNHRRSQTNWQTLYKEHGKVTPN